MAWLETDCVCGASASEPLFAVRDINFANLPEKGMLVRCTNCGSLRPDRFPDPELLARSYSRYYTRRTRSGRSLSALMTALRTSYIYRDVATGIRKLLDYGCGGGDFLRQVKARFPDIELSGTDITEPGDAAGDFRWIEIPRLPTRQFDYVTCSHVIEHGADSEQVAADLARVSSETGRIWLSTPNATSFLFGSAGAYARDVDFPRHRTIFTRSALSAMFLRHGYRPRWLVSPRLNTILNAVQSMRNVVGDRGLPKLRRTGIASRILFATARHLAKSARRRALDEPELVAIWEPLPSAASGRKSA